MYHKMKFQLIVAQFLENILDILNIETKAMRQ